MKKFILISGIATINLMMAGCLFKVFHWPGANVLLTLSIFLFCFCFLPMALYNHYVSQESKQGPLLHVVTFVVFFLGLLASLFKIMHWVGAGPLLVLSLPLPFVLFLPVYLYRTRNDKQPGNLQFIGVMMGLMFLAVFSAMLVY